MNPMDLGDNWYFVYEKRNYDLAMNVLASLQHACKAISMRVGEPHWIELSYPDPTKMMDRIKEAQAYSKEYIPIAFMLLTKEHDYSDLKSELIKNKLLSQAIQYKTAKKINASIASNILKQMCSKLGGDLYHIQFSPEISPLTMLIGIDVCHKSSQSIVGFVCSIDKKMAQYYS
jgi:hypothetical protein